ncbi:MAG: DUF2177 family protein [Sphingobacteriales bacterium]|nr:MAG: DUF2177 family protein [Sphingobacteriales bacterium]
MNTKFLLAVVSVLVFVFIVDSVFYGFLMKDFFANVPCQNPEPDMIYLIIGLIIYSFAFTYLFSKSGFGGSKIESGAMFGAVVGLMSGIGLNLIWLATTEGFTITMALVDGVYRVVVLAAAGIVASYVLNR